MISTSLDIEHKFNQREALQFDFRQSANVKNDHYRFMSTF